MARSSDDPGTRPVAGHMFLGGLAADDAYDDGLPVELADLLETARGLLGEYRTGQLDAPALGGALARLVAVDDEGDEWTVGASTLSWYRRTPGLPWTQVARPSHDVVVPHPAPTRAQLDGTAGDRRGTVPEAPPLEPLDPRAGSGPWGDLPVGAGGEDLPAPSGPGPWSGSALAAAAPAPPTEPLGGPFSSLPPAPGRADGPLTGTGLEDLGADPGHG